MKNKGVPDQIQNLLSLSRKAQTPTSSDNASSVEKVVESAENMLSDKEWYDNFQSISELLPDTISWKDHQDRSKRPLIPAHLPYGLNMQEIREERERVVHRIVTDRLAELDQLPANIGVWDTTKSDAPDGDDSLKRRLLIERGKLRLLQKQKLLRAEVSRGMLSFVRGNTVNRASHRRMKKPTLREAQVTEKLEKQQRDARETREKKKQYDHLQAIINHRAATVQATEQSEMRAHKLGRAMIQHHQHMEREEARRVERTAKQRLQALKANDEETYLKLLGQAKDSRITHLLNQTDKFLKELAASVRKQQRNQAERYGDNEDLEDEEEEELANSEDEGEDTSGGKKKIDYYAVAHRIQEQVTEQPSILVGGTLKEYQLKGLQWMISLYNNNLNGILADEMRCTC